MNFSGNDLDTIKRPSHNLIPLKDYPQFVVSFFSIANSLSFVFTRFFFKILLTKKEIEVSLQISKY